MKKLYVLLFFIASLSLHAQTTINYAQRVANYDAFFTDSGGNFDNGTDEFGMWANGADPKQSVAWRSFTETGLPGGTPSVMAIGDSFTITVSATQASFGVIGMALLSSPATATWADRISNYAVQVNLNGNGGANDPWEVVSVGGTINASGIGGSEVYADFKFKFTLDSATTMTVSINEDPLATYSITLNATNITGYSVYFQDDWNGGANANIFWKPLTEYTYAMTLGTEDFMSPSVLTAYPNPTADTFKINDAVSAVQIYDLTGKLVKSFRGNFSKNHSYTISDLNQSLFFVKIENSRGEQSVVKLLKI